MQKMQKMPTAIIKLSKIFKMLKLSKNNVKNKTCIKSKKAKWAINVKKKQKRE